MQLTGYIMINGLIIKVLARIRWTPPYTVQLKQCFSGKLRQHLTDEEDYLKTRPDLIERLLKGYIIKF